ncbi:MAG: hypothetical protein ACE5FG_06590 [Myxococcota bacterium]
MGKVFAIGLIVLGIWVGLSVYTDGSERAFGGLFSGFSRPEAETLQKDPPLDRIRSRAEAARDEGLDRIERALSHE